MNGASLKLRQRLRKRRRMGGPGELRLSTPAKAEVRGAAMHAFDIPGDPVRRRILELLACGESSGGNIREMIQKEFGITQAGVSQYLWVLRESGFTRIRIEGTKRIYAVDSKPLQEIDAWIGQFHGFWKVRLNALTREIAREKAERREDDLS